MNIALDLINREVEQEPAAFIRDMNIRYREYLQKVAADIAEHREERPIILLSGPSGSGKTTSAMMIEKILDEQGIETHTLSLDNYFSPFNDEERKLYAEGRLDLESPQRIDTEFLVSQLRSIYNCEPIELPVYDFKESQRLISGKILERKPGELVIFEGIHALNPDVLAIPDEYTAKMYVSVRTRIMKNGKALHPSRIRLMRRLVRDMHFRKRSFEDTLSMFESVEAGENKYIMPYKHRSDYDVDTFMAYEICAYRPFLIDAFRTMTDSPLVQEMLEFLEDTAPLDESYITPDSLVCEFVGNGQFEY
ncbi:MAG: adenylyl-sulfate kinase [Oscillospiraceae bacterium]|nr:adenylyl-sulfate kinase [Oscillospiraceae bacterium]